MASDILQRELISYQLAYQKFHYYFNCITGDFLSHPHSNVRFQWIEYCKTDPSEFGMDRDEVKPFKFIFKEYNSEDGGGGRYVEADPDAVIVKLSRYEENALYGPGRWLGLEPDLEKT